MLQSIQHQNEWQQYYTIVCKQIILYLTILIIYINCATVNFVYITKEESMSMTYHINYLRLMIQNVHSVQHQRRINGNRYPVTGPESALSGNFYLFIESSGRRDRDKARLKLQGQFRVDRLIDYKCVAIKGRMTIQFINCNKTKIN